MPVDAYCTPNSFKAGNIVKLKKMRDLLTLLVELCPSIDKMQDIRVIYLSLIIGGG